MAETVYTPDGKLHTLLGSCTIGEIVREYAGEDAAKLVENLVSKNTCAGADVETDLLSYERDLDHWHRMAQDWAGELEAIAKKFDSDKVLCRADAAKRIRLLKKQIESEL